MMSPINKIAYASFTHNGWSCWYNDTTGTWGAILSRKGRQPVIVDGAATKEELIERIK
jgi:hypothetical protein